MTRYRHLITDDNRKWWTLGAMCFALFMIMLDNTVVNVALPSIQRDLGASISGLEWTINGYTLSFAVLLATGGRLGDIFGRRRMFLIGVVIFALSSATAGLAQNPTDLVAQPRRPGRRRGADDAGDALDRHRRLPAARARQGDGDLGRRLRPGARGRPGASAACSPSTSAGGRSSTSTSRSRSAPSSRRCSRCASRATRPSAARSTTPASRVLTASLTALILALVEGNSWGWGSTEIVALLVGAADRPGRLRRDRAAGQGADGRIPLLLRPQLPRRGGRRPDHLLRDAGRLLLPRPLHAGHPPLLAAGGGGQVPALDPDDRRRGADRRPPGRPLRPALADRRRPAPAHRLPLQLQRDRGRLRPTSTCCPASCCSASASR